MKAVLLAAGTGSRLRPLTNGTPKCLVPINGKPLLDFWLEKLTTTPAIDEIFINVSYLKEQVLAHINTHWESSPQISIWNEERLLGTAGTLVNNVNKLINDDIFVAHADNLSVFDLDAFINSHKNRPTDCDMSMMLFKTDQPSSCGIVEIDSDGRLLKMHEKVSNPPGNLANGAVYIFEPCVISWIQQRQPFDISNDVIPAFTGRISTWLNSRYHRDIGTPESYARAQRDFLDFSRDPELINSPLESISIDR